MLSLLRASALWPALAVAAAALRALAGRCVALGAAGVAIAAELAGFFVITVGLWLIWPPLALLFGGAIMVFLAQGVRAGPGKAVKRDAGS